MPSPPRPEQAATDDAELADSSNDDEEDTRALEEVVVPWKSYARMVSEAKATLLASRGDPAAYSLCVRQMWAFLKAKQHLVSHMGGGFPSVHEIIAVFKIHTFIRSCFFQHDVPADNVSLDDLRRLIQRHVGSTDAHGHTDISLSIVSLVLLFMKVAPSSAFASRAEPRSVRLQLEFIDTDRASAYNVFHVVDGVTALVTGLRNCPVWFPNRMFKAADTLFRWCAAHQASFDDLSYVKYLCTAAGSLYFMEDMYRYYEAAKEAIPSRSPAKSVQRWVDEDVLLISGGMVRAKDWARAHMKPDSARLRQCYASELATATFPYEQRVPEKYRHHALRPMPWDILRCRRATSAKPWLWMPVAAFYLAVIERVGYYQPDVSFLALHEVLAAFVSPQHVVSDVASAAGSAYWNVSVPNVGIVAASSSSSAAAAAAAVVSGDILSEA